MWGDLASGSLVRSSSGFPHDAVAAVGNYVGQHRVFCERRGVQFGTAKPSPFLTGCPLDAWIDASIAEPHLVLYWGAYRNGPIARGLNIPAAAAWELL